MSTGDLGDMDLPAAINMLRGDVSFDQLAAAVDYRISSQTLQRYGDPSRPYPTPVRVESLVAAADAINAATPRKTTWWALWIAHGISFERMLGLTGRTGDREVNALPYLPPGWVDLAPDRFAAWNRVGAALVIEQQIASRDADASQLRAENDRLRARLAALEADPPPRATVGARGRAKP